MVFRTDEGSFVLLSAENLEFLLVVQQVIDFLSDGVYFVLPAHDVILIVPADIPFGQIFTDFVLELSFFYELAVRYFGWVDGSSVFLAFGR